ncbi:hypothetical protein GRX01_10870 [Halobaculum sp. WSA2]|uniref:Uncharacterized protein n=1 Tax=Halobaculum saliterrae TaxID=2073113 RepID=A0A6B0ST27_9EURY|nr:hypothetical protein [Halobaculum saliterrae]MXR41835.1 hypothetical protein [Halobaculum saliterrae]
MRERSGRTRRAVLAGAGAALAGSLAGCGALPGGDDESTVSGDELASVLAESPPAVPERLPVAIEASAATSRADEIDASLAAVPAPLDATQVPNGAIRERLDRAHERANEALARASEASTPWSRMGQLRRAGSEAAFVGGGWEAVDAGRDLGDVRDDGAALRADLRAFRSEWHYRGRDAVEAVVVNDAIAGLVRSCIAALNEVLSAQPDGNATALAVAEADEELATARGAVQDAAHVFERLNAADGVASRREALSAAADALVSSVAERRDAVGIGRGEEPSELDRDALPAERALRDLREDLRRDERPAEARDAGEFPRAIVAAHAALARLGAVERLRSRVDAGEVIDVASAADVRAIRTRAVESVRSAHADGPHPRLDRLRLHRLAATLRYLDDELARVDGGNEVSLGRFRWELSDYARVAATARAVGDASAAVARALTRA